MRTIPKSNWFEGIVNTDNDHIKISHGDDKETIALVEPVSKRDFKVQFLIDRDTADNQNLKALEKVRQELNFYFVELGEKQPWEYAIYHCNTAANIYSKVHWSYYPKSCQT